MPNDIAIVGAGITGLTTARHLEPYDDVDVTIFEAAEHPGGPVRSVDRDGYLLERGPHTILAKNRATDTLIDELDLESAVVEPDDDADTRYIVRDGQLHAAPMSGSDFLQTDLFSPTAKLRLLAEPFVPARRDDVDESLANFVRRRLGGEVLDYAVGPFVGGVFAGRPRLLSARHAFDSVHAWERDYGSLAGGLVASLLDRALGDTPSASGQLLSFEQGSQQLVDRLADHLDDALHCETPVRGLERDTDDDWHLTVETETADRSVRGPFDTVLWTAPTPELADTPLRTPTGTDDRLDVFDEITYPPLAIVALGVDSTQVDHPLDGFGALVPEVEPNRILGTLFMSSLFPGRAPSGRELLTTFVGGARHPELVDRDDGDLVSLVQSELRELIGLDGRPEMVDVYRWERAIPQYEVGYDRFLDLMAALEADHPGLVLAGNYRNGIGVPDLIDASEHVADRLLTANDR